MIRGLYSASSGMMAQSINQDVIANNIANVQTPGFKRQRLVTESFAQALEKSTAAQISERFKPAYPSSPVDSACVQTQAGVDNTEGAAIETGNVLDMRIVGDGSFQVQGPYGMFLTRAGNFTRNASGELCAADGDKIMGEKGTITLPQGEVKVSSDGTIAVDGTTIDKIKIVGGNTKTSLLNGSLEGSNVSVIKEMVSMITNLRSYEANQKVVSSIDESLGKLINEVGKV